MQKSRVPRPHGRPRRKPREGATAEFARAIARAEFGRHYVDDRQLEEVQRSLAGAKVRRAQPTGSKAPASRKRKPGETR